MAENRGFRQRVSLEFDEAAALRMERDAEEALRKAAGAGSEAFERAMAAGGSKAVKALSTAVRTEYERTMAKARVDLAQQLIDKRQFDEIAASANAALNGQLIPLMGKLQREGKVTESQFAQLSRMIKTTGGGMSDQVDEATRSVRALAAGLEATHRQAVANARIKLGAGDREGYKQDVASAAAAYNAKLIPAIEQLRKEGKLTDDEFEQLAGTLKDVADAGDAAGGVFGRLEQRFGAAAGALASFFAIDRIKDWSAAMLEGVATAEDVAGYYEQVFTGAARTQMSAFIDGRANKMGSTATELRGTMALLGQITQAMEMGEKASATFSERVARLAADLRAVKGGDLQSALDAIMATFRGEYDPLERYGIMLKAADVQSTALAQTTKSSTDELTKAELAVATLDLAYQGAGKSVGQFDREMGGLSQRTGEITARFREFKEDIAYSLLPLFDALIGATGGATKGLTESTDATGGWKVAIAAAALVVGSLVGVIGSLALALGGLATVLGVSLLPLVAVGAPLILGIGALAAVLFKQGQEARAATLRNKEYTESLEEMTIAELEAEEVRITNERNRLKREGRYDRPLANLIVGAPSYAQIRENRRVPTPEAQILEDQDQALRLAFVKYYTSDPATRDNPRHGGAGGGKPDATDPVEIIDQLRQLAQVRRLNVDETRELAAAEADINRQLAAGNVARAREIELRGALEQADAARHGPKQKKDGERQTLSDLIGLHRDLAARRGLTAEQTATLEHIEARLVQRIAAGIPNLKELTQAERDLAAVREVLEGDETRAIERLQQLIQVRGLNGAEIVELQQIQASLNAEVRAGIADTEREIVVRRRLIAVNQMLEQSGRGLARAADIDTSGVDRLRGRTSSPQPAQPEDARRREAMIAQFARERTAASYVNWRHKGEGILTDEDLRRMQGMLSITEQLKLAFMQAFHTGKTFAQEFIETTTAALQVLVSGVANAFATLFQTWSDARRQASEARREIRLIHREQAEGLISAEEASRRLADANEILAQTSGMAARAFKAGMLDALAAVVRAYGEMFIALATASVAQAIKDKDPSLLKAAAKYTAAGFAMMALAGRLGAAAAAAASAPTGSLGGDSGSDREEEHEVQANRIAPSASRGAPQFTAADMDMFTQHLAAQTSFMREMVSLAARPPDIAFGNPAVEDAIAMGTRTGVYSERGTVNVEVYIDPLDPHSPATQRVVFAANRNAEERYGPNVSISVLPRTGSSGSGNNGEG